MRDVLVGSVMLLSAACGDNEVALSDATSLNCPTPGALPFRLERNGFQRAGHEQLVADNPRSKAEASDTIGNPGGAVALSYDLDTESPVAMPVEYRGAAAVTTHTQGLFNKPLAGEPVSLWSFDTATEAWQSIGRTETDDSGIYDLPDTAFVAPNGQPTYAVLEGDGNCAEHYTYLLPSDSKVVVSDIDGTLTLNDNEFLLQVSDDAHVPEMMGAGDRMTQAWATKGYPIIYLTARPHLFRNETRVWLRDLGFPTGPVITAADGSDAAAYKTAWLRRMVDDFGWDVVAAYGNASTDIAAYDNAAIPKDHTFIVGDLAGTMGTVAIENNDYTAHITAFIAAQPDNN